MNARRRRLAAHRTGVEIAPAVDEVTLLLPWYAIGALDDQDTRRVDAALRRRPTLAAQVAEISSECAEIAALSHALGRPSPRALRRLFDAIDADEGRAPVMSGASVQALHLARSNAAARRSATLQPALKKIRCCV